MKDLRGFMLEGVKQLEVFDPVGEVWAPIPPGIVDDVVPGIVPQVWDWGPKLKPRPELEPGCMRTALAMLMVSITDQPKCVVLYPHFRHARVSQFGTGKFEHSRHQVAEWSRDFWKTVQSDAHFKSLKRRYHRLSGGSFDRQEGAA